MKEDIDKLKVEMLQAEVEEAHRYKRDTTRRTERVTVFYVTAAGALGGVAVVPFAFELKVAEPAAFVLFGTFILFWLGLITYMRLVNIKVQAAQHTAWQEGTTYALVSLVAPERLPSRKPSLPTHAGSPFEEHTMPALHLFAILNGLVLAIAAGAAEDLLINVLDARSVAKFAEWQPAHNVVCILAAIWLIPAVYWISRRYIRKRRIMAWGRANWVLQNSLKGVGETPVPPTAAPDGQ